MNQSSRITRGLFIGLVALSSFSLSGCYSANAVTSPDRVVRITTLPRGAKVITVKRQTYHYHDGRFYQRQRGAYISVKPPIGTVVTTLPRRRTVVRVKGQRRYVVNDIHYRAERQRGRTVYVVVRR
ncbi:MAG: hypothetical protein RhofKO_02440 [Rhodothermales bacterium]